MGLEINGSSRKTVLDVSGICCPSEASVVERILKPLSGIERVFVNVPIKTVTVVHNQHLVSPSQIANALNEARLNATVRNNNGESKTSTRAKWPSPYTVASGILVAIAFFKFWLPPLQWVALGAVAVGIIPMLRKSVAALCSFVMDINVLMVVAVGGAIGLGNYTEAGSIVFLFTLAEWLESRSSDKARAAISFLVNIAPQTAVMEETGLKLAVKDVPVKTLIAVKAGEMIPMDGIVIAGISSVDESSFSGESIPVEKHIGSNVWAGTLNLTGYMSVRTEALAEDSAIARMAKLVEEAQNHRSPTELFVQECAKYYTPVVVLAAVGLGVGPWIIGVKDMHRWFYLALILLVVACPCALVISTPVTTACGLSQAARMGLLIKGGSFLEALGKVKLIAFDKTGTLTEGQFRVIDIECVEETTDVQQLLYWICSVENKSSHPMASALVTYSQHHGVDPSPEVNNLEVIAGEGVMGLVDGHRIHIGNARLANRLGWATIAPKAPRINKEGATVGYVVVDERLVGIFSVGDRSRTEAVEAVDDLKKLGLQLAMLTGDTHTAAKTVQTQIDAAAEMKIYSELLPEEKMRIVRELKKKMGVIAMVGDGINDAPALASADIGIAMGVTGSSVAMETADIALMSNDIRKIASAVKLGRKSLGKIYQNVAFSFVIKAVFIFLAFTGHTSLWAAVLADMGTCLLVTFNSMLLLDKKVQKKLPMDDHNPINARECQTNRRTDLITTTSGSKSMPENTACICECKSVLHPNIGCGSTSSNPRNRCCENPISNEELRVPLLSEKSHFTNSCSMPLSNFNDSLTSLNQQKPHITSCSSRNCVDCEKNIVPNIPNDQLFNAVNQSVGRLLEIVVESECDTNMKIEHKKGEE